MRSNCATRRKSNTGLRLDPGWSYQWAGQHEQGANCPTLLVAVAASRVPVEHTLVRTDEFGSRQVPAAVEYSHLIEQTSVIGAKQLIAPGKCACSVCCLGGAMRLPPTKSWKRSSRRAT